jgi:hypothetical protein
MTAAIKGGWKKCYRGHEGYSVEPHLDFCFEHAPPEYKAAWLKHNGEIRAKEQELIDYFGKETFEWAMKNLRGSLRLPTSEER